LCFGFLPNVALSIHKNTHEVMGDTSPGCYFLKATNKSFLGLTGGKSLVPATTSLLGLSLKFIPTPCYASSVMDIAPSLDGIHHDVGLKTFFSQCDQGREIPILRAKSSSLHPPLPPRQVDYRINSFLTKIQVYFDGEQASKASPPINDNTLLPSRMLVAVR
jgi:hypothetical protein